MRITATPSVIRGVLGIGLFIPLTPEEAAELKEGQEYEIDLHKPRKARTLTANSYCWVLCQKIAEKLTIGGTYHSKEDIYRKAIKDCGHCQYVAVKETAVERFCANWQNQGLGWVTEDMGACKNVKKCRTIAVYHGSSVYDGEEMARLIDCLVDEAHQIGVETRPQWEVDALLKEWEGE